MKYPSLRIWILTGIIISLIILTLDHFRADIRRLLFNRSIQAAFVNADSNHGDVRVVLLGSSHFKESLSDPDELSMLANQNKDSINYSFVKITRGIGTLEDYSQNKILVEMIDSYDPTYVVIQESISFFGRKKTLYSFGLQNDIQLLLHLKALFNNKAYLKKMSNSKNRSVADSTLEDHTRMSPKKMIRSNDHALSNFIKKINRKVIILHVPVPVPIEEELDSVRNTATYISLYEQEKLAADFSTFWFPHPMPHKLYYDRGHMNINGGKIYTQWFINTLHQFHQTQQANKNQ